MTLNPLLNDLDVDFLYHFGLDTTMPLNEMFGDVKFVIMGGKVSRMQKMANLLAGKLHKPLQIGTKLTTIGTSDRYSLFKVGNVLCVNHSIGGPSITIVLHEITKLLLYGGAKDFKYIRIGTSGGVGLEPGTVVIAKKVVSSCLEPVEHTFHLGKKKEFPLKVDEKMAEEIMKHVSNQPAVFGTTLGTDDFYEEQGRLDGAICDYTVEDRQVFLQTLKGHNITNMEMETVAFSRFCTRANIPCAVLCVTLLDRLKGDQVTLSAKILSEFADNLMAIVARYIAAKCADVFLAE